MNDEKVKTGDVIDHLTVLGVDPNHKSNRLCKCDCGDTCSIKAGELNRQLKLINNPELLEQYKKEKGKSNRRILSCGHISRDMYKDMVGKKYNHLDVLQWRHSKSGNEIEVKCDCGTSEPYWVKAGEVFRNRKKSCLGFDCPYTRSKQRNNGPRKSKHGVSKESDEVKSLNLRWGSMHQRCYNPKHKSYPSYGQKGIKICHEWNEDNPEGRTNYVKWFLEEKKKIGVDNILEVTIDRIDGSGDYCPNNCRLVSKSIQSANRKGHSNRVDPELPRNISKHKLANGDFKYNVSLEYKDKFITGNRFLTINEALVFTHMMKYKYELMYTLLDAFDTTIEICDYDTTLKYGKLGIIENKPIVIGYRNKGYDVIHYKYHVEPYTKKVPPFVRTIRWKDSDNNWVYGTTCFNSTLLHMVIAEARLIKQ